MQKKKNGVVPVLEEILPNALVGEQVAQLIVTVLQEEWGHAILWF
jgi:hypothetical protein